MSDLGKTRMGSAILAVVILVLGCGGGIVIGSMIPGVEGLIVTILIIGGAVIVGMYFFWVKGVFGVGIKKRG